MSMNQWVHQRRSLRMYINISRSVRARAIAKLIVSDLTLSYR